MLGGPSTSWRTGLYARRSRPDKRLPATGKQFMHRSKEKEQGRDHRQPASSSCTGQRRRGRVEVTGNRQAAHEEEEQCRWSRHNS